MILLSLLNTSPQGDIVKLLFIALFEEALLDEVLESFVELDIGAVSVIDATGIGTALVTDDPIFAGFRDIAQRHHYQKLILALIPTDELYVEANHILCEICDFEKEPQRGYRFSIRARDFMGRPEVF